MKISKITAIAIMLLMPAFFSCSKSNNTSGSTTAGIVQQGTWRVTLYSDNGTDETNNFTGYTLTFNSNGTVAALKNASTINGTWNTRTDNSQQKLILDFGATVPLSKLNNDWHIIEQIAAKLRLEDVSGGGGGTDLLTIEKN